MLSRIVLALQVVGPQHHERATAWSRPAFRNTDPSRSECPAPHISPRAALAQWRTHRAAKSRANAHRSFSRRCSASADASLRAITEEFAPSRSHTDARIQCSADATRPREHLALDQRCCFSPKNFLLLCSICAMLLKIFCAKLVDASNGNKNSREMRFESLVAWRAT